MKQYQSWFFIIAFFFIANPCNAYQRTALIIGNSSYLTSPLKNTSNDARDMANTLKKLDFEVIEKHNLNKSEMRKAVRNFGYQLEKGGVGLFFYAGHGVQVDGTNYLIPTNADIADESEVPDQALSVDLIIRKMQSAGNSLNIIILDACRNNPYASSFRSGTRGLARVEGPVGSVIAYSTSPGSVATDGKGSNSVYTKHLIREIQRPNIPIELVLKRVRVNVSRETSNEQIPWESSSLIGDFIFSYADNTSMPTKGIKLRTKLNQLENTRPMTNEVIIEAERIFARIEQQESHRGYEIFLERNKILANLHKIIIEQALSENSVHQQYDLLNHYKILEQLAPDHKLLSEKKKIEVRTIKKLNTNNKQQNLIIPPRF